MFSGRHRIKEYNDQVFLDRDGKTFEFLINYLRNTKSELPIFESEDQARLFSTELDFWGIETFDEQEDKSLISKFPSSL